MKTKGIAILSLITLLSATLVTVIQTLPPSSLPATAPADEFSAERAMRHIQIIAARPRLTGSPSYRAAQSYVVSELKDLGLGTEIQHSGELQNTVAWIKGTHSSDIVLLTAHLDSVASNPGASDDATGVAVLLETARALMATGPLHNTVLFLFTDHEEGGFFGAKAFIAYHPWVNDVRIVLGFDAGGPRGPGVLSATSPDDGWLIRQLARADPYLVGSSAINALAYSSTDFGRAFNAAGFSGYEFDLYWERFNLDWESRIYRTLEDTIENVNLSSLQHQGYHALSLARYLGNLDHVADPKEPDAVFFNLLRILTIAYPSTWAAPLALMVTIVFFFVLASGFKQRILTWSDLGFGAFVLIGGVIIAPLPNILLEIWMPDIILRLLGRPLDQPKVLTAEVLSALALIITWYVISRRIRKTSNPNLSLGALMPMLGAMIGTSLAFPFLSFAFTWPLLLSLLAHANYFYWHVRKKNSKMIFAGLITSGAVNIMILGPTIILGMFDQPRLTLLLLGVLSGFLYPIFLQISYYSPKPRK